MIRKLVTLILFTLVSAPAFTQKPPASLDFVALRDKEEGSARGDLWNQLVAPIGSEDFAALDNIHDTLLATRQRTPSGLWMLAFYYQWLEIVVTDGLDRKTDCRVSGRELLRKWLANEPGSAPAVILSAIAEINQAWCFRGNGLARDVRQEDWPRFYQGLNTALSILSSNHKTASSDPHYYVVMIQAMLGNHTSRYDVEQVVREATATIKDYPDLYFAASMHFLPRWSGDDLSFDTFARDAARISEDAEGKGMYARIYWNVKDIDPDVFMRSSDWVLLKDGMRDVVARYPTKWNSISFADIACAAKDTDAGREFIRQSYPGQTDQRLSINFAFCDAAARSVKPSF